jgi:hypothetical protein
MKTRTVKPYGMLYSEGREYFLLQPFPLESDSWEWEGEHRKAFRFVVVPRKIIKKLLRKLETNQFYRPNDSARNIYPHARHIVTTSFNVEYADMPEILVKVIELELSEQELGFKTNLEECEYE